MPNQNDKLSQLAAIAQIYGSLSGPQFHQEEVARQQQRDQQNMAFQMMQLQQQHEYQTGMLANEANRTGIVQSDALARIDEAKNVAGAREQGRSDALDERAYHALEADPNTDHHALALASMDTSPGTFIQKYSTHKQANDLVNAQNAWNAVASNGWDKMTPQARASVYTGLAQKYPAISSGQVDFSQGLPEGAMPPTIGSPGAGTPTTDAGAAGASVRQSLGGLFSGLGNLGGVIGNNTTVPVHNFFNQLLNHPEVQPYVVPPTPALPGLTQYPSMAF